MGRQVFGTHGLSGNVFANPTASSSAPYPKESNPWVSNVSDHMWWVEAKHQFRIRDAGQPEIQSSLVRAIFRRIMVQTNNDCRFQIFIVTNSPHQQHLLVGRSKTDVCTWSQFPTGAMLWFKEVEMVESVDDRKSSCSVGGFQMPNFEVLDAKIA